MRDNEKMKDLGSIIKKLAQPVTIVLGVIAVTLAYTPSKAYARDKCQSDLKELTSIHHSESPNDYIIFGKWYSDQLKKRFVL